MMGIMPWSKEHKSETRARIVQAAADAFRERGIDGIGVAEVMKRADLTHGGFYAHFKSKDDLVKAAFDQMSREIAGTVGATEYLAERHMLHPERGCPLPTVGTELVRSGAKMRRSVAGEIRTRLARIAGRLGKRRDTETDAAGAFACMVGVWLSRAPFPKMKAARSSNAVALFYAARSARRSFRRLFLISNAIQHKFVDIHTTRAPLSLGKLLDGPCDPPGPGLGFLGRFDPADPNPASVGRERPPQRLCIVGSIESSSQIDGDGWFGLGSQDGELHSVAGFGTGARQHRLVHVQPVASGCVWFHCCTERMTVHGAFDLRHAAQLAAHDFGNVEQSRGPSFCQIGTPNEPRVEAQNRWPAIALVLACRFVHSASASATARSSSQALPAAMRITTSSFPKTPFRTVAPGDLVTFGGGAPWLS